MTRITLKYNINGGQYHYLTDTSWFSYTSYIQFTEYKTNKNIVVPWNNIAVIDENYEENKSIL